MKNKYLLTALLIFSSAALSAQTFRGTVYSKKISGATEVLPYAQVYHIEAKKLIETDEFGVFVMKGGDIKEKATLVATYVGYSKDTVIVTKGMTEASFYLQGSNEVEESVVTARQPGISKLSAVKTEVITTAGLCKMACCNLAESFENSASVTVGFSDAVTGARQIKLLGLSGVYTQMLDENRPVMRGLASPFGLSYIPGQWLQSIQIAKGPSSVINGNEAITGQINMEHRKPTDEVPLFIQLFGSSETKTEANVASSLQLNKKWSTVLLGHFSTDFKTFDHNEDGFRDDPRTRQYNFANRWLYYGADGTQVRFGIKLLDDERLGGQVAYDRSMDHMTSKYWGSLIRNRSVNGYLKVGVPLSSDNSKNIALVSDYTYYDMDSYFGRRDYNGDQNSVFVNLIFQNEINDHHKYELGISGQYDNFDEVLSSYFPAYYFSEDDSSIRHEYNYLDRIEKSAGAFGEYTYRNGDKITFVGGIRVDYNNLYKWMVAPRATLKYSFTDKLVLRLSGGKGYHSPNLIADNLGILSTGRSIQIESYGMEEAWTYGGNFTAYLPFGFEDNSYLSLEYFRNDFINQVIVDQEYDSDHVYIYNLDGKSYTNTWQMDFSVDPVERFNIVATVRYTDAKMTLKGSSTPVERPMTSRFKAVLNMQYATNLSKWIFDFTAQLNGKMRLPNFMKDEYSPVYPMLFAQVTRKFKGIDVYVGGENLTNYRQKEAVLSAENPFSRDFNASVVWGPLMGRKFFAGVRITLWK